MINVKSQWFLVIAISLITFSCKDNFLGGGGNQPAFQATGKSTDAVGNGNINDNTGAGAAANGNVNDNAGPGAPTNGNLDGSTGPKSPSDGNVVDASGPNGGGTVSDKNDWQPNTVITDFGTLEKCKTDIYKATGDFALCMKCFDQWVKNGQKITAAECGCYVKPGDIATTPPAAATTTTTATPATTPAVVP